MEEVFSYLWHMGKKTTLLLFHNMGKKLQIIVTEKRRMGHR